MTDINKTARELYRLLQAKEKTRSFDATATVRHVEDGVAWVHFEGGADETPAKLTIDAKEGDTVQVRIVNGRAYLVGNATAPPTDDTTAVLAREFADTAYTAATSAQGSANEAAIAAGNAQASANTANQAANNALIGLGTVESVVDMVNWFTEHRKLSTDGSVVTGKSYYTYDSTTGTLTKVDPVGTEDPSAEGWYEIDEAISEYVATHVATTADGLYVVATVNGWRVLVSAGGGDYAAGIYLIDASGNIAQSTTASGVAFNTGKPVTIGDSTAYMQFDGNGHIALIGSDITVGGANNVNGSLTVKDASGNPIGTLNNAGANFKTAFGHIDISSGNNTMQIITDPDDDFSGDIGGVDVIDNSSTPSTSSHLGASQFYGYTSNGQIVPLLIEWGLGHGGNILLTQGLAGVNPNQNEVSIETNPTTLNSPRIKLRGATSSSNAFLSVNPSIEFANISNSQNIALVFSDVDSVASPASITLAGNQGGEYFIAPNIKATGGFFDGSGNSLLSGLYAKGTFTGDMNSTTIAVGIYQIGAANSASNVPSGFTYGDFFQLPYYTAQVLVNSQYIFYRTRTGTPAAWNSWRRLSGTAV